MNQHKSVHQLQSQSQRQELCYITDTKAIGSQQQQPGAEPFAGQHQGSSGSMGDVGGQFGELLPTLMGVDVAPQ